MLRCNFSGDYNSERIFKIGQYLTKLCVEHLGFTFFGPPCRLISIHFRILNGPDSRFSSARLTVTKNLKINFRDSVLYTPIQIWESSPAPAPTLMTNVVHVSKSDSG